MSKYSCDVIKDLIPLYIDGVCSKETGDLLEEHFRECPECKALYDSMKEDIIEEIVKEDKTTTISSLEEKRIISKVNDRIEKKNNIVKAVCIGVCVLLAVVGLLFILPIRRIPKENISVEIEKVNDVVINSSNQFDLDLSGLTADEKWYRGSAFNEPGWKDDTIFLYPSDKNIDECRFFDVRVLGYFDYNIAVASDYINEDGTVEITAVNIKSDYAIKNYYEEYKVENGETVFNLKSAYTTLLGRQGSNVQSRVVLFY
ncbi:MAG: zf-HC2 domain-containing protein [Lachnospiraceae bacterium]|nr:zf-HC2 domain-containing protein [Lachnospiraceae bacterium]